MLLMFKFLNIKIKGSGIQDIINIPVFNCMCIGISGGLKFPEMVFSALFPEIVLASNLEL